MKRLNIRRFATPMIIGAGVISAITGAADVLYYGITLPIRT